MVIKELPNPEGFDCGSSNDRNTVIWASSSTAYNYPKHDTPYLFLANFKSAGNYLLNKQHVSISEHFFYFLNKGDNLEITFRGKEPIETVFIMFSPFLIDEVAACIYDSPAALLENPKRVCTGKPLIPSIPFDYCEALTTKLKTLKHVGRFESEDEFYYDFAESLLTQVAKECKKANGLPAIRQSTREELFRRVMIGKAFMHDNFDRRLGVEEIAVTACLNKFHFIKIFKSANGLTPHQYLTRIRLDKARQLLLTGNCSVKDVSQSIGFESLASFTNLYKTHFGRVPSRERLI
ncbi:MAG TPA: AraC family transcriptional regulator [Puia sp.]|nr:AraC family transcriptional regulator [Puia sp.]